MHDAMKQTQSADTPQGGNVTHRTAMVRSPTHATDCRPEGSDLEGNLFIEASIPVGCSGLCARMSFLSGVSTPTATPIRIPMRCKRCINIEKYFAFEDYYGAEVCFRCLRQGRGTHRLKCGFQVTTSFVSRGRSTCTV